MINWPAGVDRVAFDTIDSTNKEAARRAALSTSPIWIIAGEQTAGVGRRGRAWSSTPGNFAATYMMPITGDLSSIALYSFVAALALRDAFVHATDDPERFTLKWPNDVLMDGGKVAGILLETCGVGPSHLCIGIGVNLAAAPEPAKIEPTSTAPKHLNGQITPSDFLTLLAHFFAIRAAQYETHGFEAIRTAWLNDAAKLGEVITARMPNREITGTFVTVDEGGGVVLQAGSDTHVIHAADIFF
jgi:BirA family biotin operon repressor/biotin-[acetyl-CoA-carboxylase] ligase